MAGETKHTAGPWTIDAYGAGQRIVAATKSGFEGAFRVADAHISSGLARCARIPEMQANARLIAAAPDLHASLQEMLDTFGGADPKDEHGNAVLDRAIAAIAKATGNHH